MKEVIHAGNISPSTATDSSDTLNELGRESRETAKDNRPQENKVTMGTFETCTEVVGQDNSQRRISELEQELQKLQQSKSGLDLQQIKL